MEVASSTVSARELNAVEGRNICKVLVLVETGVGTCSSRVVIYRGMDG